jgi:hypothetical protein
MTINPCLASGAHLCLSVAINSFFPFVPFVPSSFNSDPFA